LNKSLGEKSSSPGGSSASKPFKVAAQVSSLATPQGKGKDKMTEPSFERQSSSEPEDKASLEAEPAEMTPPPPKQGRPCKQDLAKVAKKMNCG
jgi:hypothetical protein